jgi:hypothetical protein
LYCEHDLVIHEVDVRTAQKKSSQFVTHRIIYVTHKQKNIPCLLLSSSDP